MQNMGNRIGITAVIAILAVLSCFPRAALSRAQDGAVLGLDASRAPTGILYDRVVPFSRIDRYDGASSAPAVGLREWRQMYHEMRRASVADPRWPALDALSTAARKSLREGRIPIAIMNFRYDRLRRNGGGSDGTAMSDASPGDAPAGAYVESRAFAACALAEYTHRGARVLFDIGAEWYLTNDASEPVALEIDFGDGGGPRAVRIGNNAAVAYEEGGKKLIRVEMLLADGTRLAGSFEFLVAHLETPTPDDTISVTASIPYEGVAGTGEAYVYLSEFNVHITKPVIVVEGFDLDNAMNWDEIYYLLNGEHLAETLHDEGFDLILLNFTDATDYVQRNAYVIVELIEEVLAGVDPRTTATVIGASMGGLASRYALAYMESHALPHRVATFISFDAPQRGANIPLGIQYWMQLFLVESAAAEYLLSRLDTPAARQMLVYHHTDPPGATGEADPLRAGLLADLAAVGEYPAGPRIVAVANGSGSGQNQGFGAAEQIILYEYASFLVDIVGNVWAVPDGGSHIVLDGAINRIWPFPDDYLSVTVSGTRPFDSAPGGWRSSMAEMDSTEAPYGDIVALYGHHCFIPTISALDIATENLFYDISLDPDIMTRTPFDTIYCPSRNQEHVTINSENALWFLSEIRQGVAAVEEERVSGPAVTMLHQNTPNPFNPNTSIPFEISRACRVRLDIFDAAGREVAALLNDDLVRGRYVARWNGAASDGRPAASGVYFCRLLAGSHRETRKIVLCR